MNSKPKRAPNLIPKGMKDFLGRLVETLFRAVLLTMLAVSLAGALLQVFESASYSSGYRFCLATETSDACVQRPNAFLASKVSKKPDKLLKYFGSIPERVQQQWRVWVKDEAQSRTTEMTVAEFYAWVNSVWNADEQHERLHAAR